MDATEFMGLKERFGNADTQGKIDLYISSENLSPTQYRDLLKMFPINELSKLEAALE